MNQLPNENSNDMIVNISLYVNDRFIIDFNDKIEWVKSLVGYEIYDKSNLYKVGYMYCNNIYTRILYSPDHKEYAKLIPLSREAESKLNDVSKYIIKNRLRNMQFDVNIYIKNLYKGRYNV